MMSLESWDEEIGFGKVTSPRKVLVISSGLGSWQWIVIGLSGSPRVYV